jgi:electron transfer flavoprotein alpha subunit
MAEILVIAGQRDGELRPASLEAIAAAKNIKAAGDNLAVAIIAADPSAYVGDLSVEGVDEVVAVSAGSNDFQPDLFEAVVLSLAQARKPTVIATAHGVDAWSFAPAAAVKLDCGFASDVQALKYEDGELVATRAGYAEKVLVDLDFPGKETVLATIRTNVFEPAGGAASPTVTAMDAPDCAVATSHVGWQEPADAGGIDGCTRLRGGHQPRRVAGTGGCRRHRYPRFRVHPLGRPRRRRREQCRAVPGIGG